MDWTTAARNWASLGEAIAARWPEADRTEIAAIDGDRVRLNAYLGQVYGISPREAEEQIDAFLAGPFPADAMMSENQDNSQILHSGRHLPPGEDVYSEDADFGDDRLAETRVGRR